MDKTMATAAAGAADPAAPPPDPVSGEQAEDRCEKEDPHYAAVVERAAKASRGVYQNPEGQSPEGQVPEFLRTLPIEKWQTIRFRPEKSLWRGMGLPFIARFFAPGSIFNRPVSIHVIDGETIRPFAFSPSLFDFGALATEESFAGVATAFAGFRLLLPALPPQKEKELASFIGATFFRSKGPNAGYGVFARGLALDLGEPEGEEFPYFREFWLVQPRPGDLSITLYALLDAPRMTGAYKFVITPGTSCTMDVCTRLFVRDGSDGPKKIGLAPMSSMFLFSESNGSPPGDYRPEVHNSDGLLYATADETWFWRPLNNPTRLAAQRFPMQNPAGFGLLQRDADFDHYQDIGERFDRRASLWVEPRGNWGQGHIELIEIPTKTDINSNIHAFWVPDKSRDKNGAERNPAGGHYDYRLYWMNPGISPHLLGRAMSTRVIREGDIVRFLVDFEGDILKDLPAETGLSSFVETPQQAPLVEKKLIKNPVTGGWRLDFKVRAPKNDGVMQSIVTARDGSPPLQFRALLKKGENLPDPLTETWVYDLPTQ